MNANRLAELTKILRQDLSKASLPSALTNLVNSVQQAINSSNENTQRNALNAYTTLSDALERAATNELSPGQREDLEELRVSGSPVSDLVGSGLLTRITEIFQVGATNIQTLDRLRNLTAQVTALEQAVAQLGQGLDNIGLTPDSLAPGESVVGMTIPREAVTTGLRGLEKELRFFEQLMLTLTEVTEGAAAQPAVRTLRSSGFGVDLNTSLEVASLTAKIIAGAKSLLDSIVSYRKLRKHAESIGVNEKLAKQLGDESEKVKDEHVESIVADVFQQYGIDGDGRPNELRTAVRVKIEGVAARMERGFSFEVRTQLPSAANDAQKQLAGSVTALTTIRFEPITGPPLLALPEGDESDIEPDVIAKPERKKKATHTK